MQTAILEKIWPLMEEAFPPCQRRTFEQHKKVMANPLYHLEVLYEKEALAGFISYWELADGLYVEHLAVDKNQRGNGIGGKALRGIMQKSRIVLEVEIPASASEALIENRRIRFYERLGLVLQPHPYYQPAYDGSDDKVPLSVMTSGTGILSTEDFAQVKNSLYRVVHGLDFSD